MFFVGSYLSQKNIPKQDAGYILKTQETEQWNCELIVQPSVIYIGSMQGHVPTWLRCELATGRII